MAFVPLPEWCSIDGYYRIFHKSFSSDQLVVRCIVDNINDTGLASGAFGSPRKVSSVQTQGSVFFVTSACTNRVDTLRSKLGVGSWTSQLEFPLLTQWLSLATGSTSLVPMITRNTWKRMKELINLCTLTFFYLEKWRPGTLNGAQTGERKTVSSNNER